MRYTLGDKRTRRKWYGFRSKRVTEVAVGMDGNKLVWAEIGATMVPVQKFKGFPDVSKEYIPSGVVGLVGPTGLSGPSCFQHCYSLYDFVLPTATYIH